MIFFNSKYLYFVILIALNLCKVEANLHHYLPHVVVS